MLQSKSHSPVTAFLLAVLVFLSVLPSCSSSGNVVASKSVSLIEMAFATSIDATNRPLDKKSYFPSATPKIYCCVKVSNAPPDTEIRADWIYIKGADITAEENTVMDSRSVKVDGTRYLAFSFSYSRPATLWIKGEYKVILYIDGVPKVQGPFVIQ